MKIFISFLLIVGLIVMISFIGPHIYKVNKEFLTTGKVPAKPFFRFMGVAIIATVCFVIFAALIFIFLGRFIKDN